MGSPQREAKTRGKSAVAAESTMQAVVQEAYGSAEVLELRQIATPAFADNEVLVKVRAAGIDRGTLHMLSGKPHMLRIMGFGFRRPKNRVPGLDVAGTVEAVGASVTRFSPGDEVFGMSKGSLAEYAVVREAKLARKPANLTFAQAAVVPISGGTALQGLCDVGKVQQGHKVLITGASGGVGSFAVQLAKALGAEVTGVCSTTKTDLVRSLGADHVIDYTLQDFAGGTIRYDLILDIAGSTKLSTLRRALEPAGTLVIVGGEGGGNWTGGFGRSLRAPMKSLIVRPRLTMLVSKERASDLVRLTEFIEAGKVTPALDRTFPLDRAPEAMRHLEAGKVRGKIAVTV